RGAPGGQRHRCLSRPSAGGTAARRRGSVLRDLAGGRRRRRILRAQENTMNGLTRGRRGVSGCAAAIVTAWLTGANALPLASEIKVDLSQEQPGKPPVTFEPMVGTWLVAEDAGEKVIMVDGRPWAASKDNPTKLLIASARKLYGTNNEELMDNAKQFAYYPVAVLKSVKDFSNGTISLKFKTVAGDADRASG